MVQRWLEPTASKKINAITIVDSVHMTDWVCDLVLKLSFFSLLASVESLLAITMYSSCMVQTTETSVFRDWHNELSCYFVLCSSFALEYFLFVELYVS